MALEVRLPRFSDEMKEGTVTRWLKAAGDPVAAGEALAEIETEKVIVEVVAPKAGVLLEIHAAEQTVVPVNGLLCRIGEAGEMPARTTAAGTPAPAAAPGAVPRAAASGGKVVTLASRPSRDESRAPPLPAAQAAGVQAVAAQAVTAQAVATRGAPLAPGLLSPLARRVASELKLDLTQVQGTGIGGKIVLSDLEPFLAAGHAPAARAAPGRGALPAVIPSAWEAAPPEPGTVIDEPHSPLRRAIARRMAESKATIPHFYMTAELDATDLLALRMRLNATLPEARLSVNDFVLKATALALREVPALNAEYSEQALRRREAVHLGFAVATDEGLFTPVVRDCHLKSVGAIAEDAQGLIAKAKARTLTPQDLQGGTFTVSNLGMYDVAAFSAIINPPQVAILAVARPQERPVACNGRVIVRSHLNVTVSADHRAVDGVTVAKFLQAFRAVVEAPERLLV